MSNMFFQLLAWESIYYIYELYSCFSLLSIILTILLCCGQNSNSIIIFNIIYKYRNQAGSSDVNQWLIFVYE